MKAYLYYRYKSRKIYDPTQACYANLDDIVAKIRDGFDITVLDHVTLENKTADILCQALLKSSVKGLPTKLHELLRDNN
jgi:polyhydroxyalkanoate synthesis regulator protein